MKSASGAGAGAQEHVRWEMGLRAGRISGGSGKGCQGSIPTLGEGAPLKSSQRGITWKGGGTGAGNRSVEAAGLGGGLQAGIDDIGWSGGSGGEEATLGGACVGTLGQPGIGIQVGWKAGGASRHHDSKMSQRLVIASTWEFFCGRCCTREGTCDNLKTMDDSILCGRCQDGKVGAEFDCIGDDLALGVCIEKLEAVVGFHGWTNVEAILGMKVPRTLGFWLRMDKDARAYWPKWCFVEVKGPLKELPCTDPRVESGLPEEIEGEFSLWEK